MTNSKDINVYDQLTTELIKLCETYVRDEEVIAVNGELTKNEVKINKEEQIRGYRNIIVEKNGLISIYCTNTVAAKYSALIDGKAEELEEYDKYVRLNCVN